MRFPVRGWSECERQLAKYIQREWPIQLLLRKRTNSYPEVERTFQTVDEAIRHDFGRIKKSRENMFNNEAYKRPNVFPARSFVCSRSGPENEKEYSHQ